MGQHNVEVANRSRCRAELRKRPLEGALPDRIEVACGGADKGTRAPGRDTVLAEILGIDAHTDAWIVDEECLALGFEQFAYSRRTWVS